MVVGGTGLKAFRRIAEIVAKSGVPFTLHAHEETRTVEDAGRHALMGGLSGTYLAYCECTRKATGEKKQIVAAFTGGDSDNLMVGRNGIFYDRQGLDWQATITKIIDHPISIRQAFWSPYKRLGRMIGEQIEKFASARDKALDTHAADMAATAAKHAEAPKAPAAAAAAPARRYSA